MSILNVNQIQPVGSGQTVTISAANITASSSTISASSFVGGVTVTSGNLSGISTIGVTTAYIENLAGVGAGTSIQVSSGSKLVGLATGSVYAPGTILQVSSSLASGKNSTSDTTYTTLASSSDITTTVLNSKILVSITCTYGNDTTGGTGNSFINLMRTADGTDTVLLNPMANRQSNATSYMSDFFSITYLDTPNQPVGTAISYSVQARRVDGTSIPFIGGRATDTAYAAGTRFILSEVAP